MSVRPPMTTPARMRDAGRRSGSGPPGWGVRTLAALMASGLALVTVGCGQGTRAQATRVGGEPASPAPGTQQVRREDAMITWANGYCRAVSHLVQSLSAMPDIDPSTAERATSTSSALLGVMIGGLDRTLRGLAALEPAPLPGAEKVKQQAVTRYTKIRDSARVAKGRLDDASGAEASRAAIAAANEPLDELGRVNLLDFDPAPELRRASHRAPACRQLTEEGPAPRIAPGES
jgi:hypothetical protein